MTPTGKTQFNIVICGAGIAGLCSAIGLAQQGHNVTVLESAHELAAIGIGIHLPPNATVVLKHFGLLERLSEDVMYPTGFVFRRWADNEIISGSPKAADKPAAPSGTPP